MRLEQGAHRIEVFAKILEQKHFYFFHIPVGAGIGTYQIEIIFFSLGIITKPSFIFPAPLQNNQLIAQLLIGRKHHGSEQSGIFGQVGGFFLFGDNSLFQ